MIYQNERSVIALDKNTGLKAEAKCNPEDNFYFYTGAQIAFARLMNTPIHVVHPFEVGDLVIGTKKADEKYYITKKGWIGKVTEIDPDGRTITVKGYGEWSNKLTDYAGLDPSCFRLLTKDDVPAGVLALLKDKS